MFRGVATALLALCLLASTGVVTAGDKVGDFDYYVLSMFWQPAECEKDSFYPGCKRPDHGFQKANLVIHGLWPQWTKSRGRNMGPSYCSGERWTTSQRWKLESKLDQFWPSNRDNQDGLWKHEWKKHGTCSGMSLQQYFDKSMELAKKLGTPASIRNNFGNSVTIDELYAAFGPKGHSKGKKYAGFRCQGNGGALTEVRVCYDKKFKEMPCAKNVGKDNCPTRVPIVKFWEVSSKDNPCTKSVQKRCLALGRASCDFGSTACGECKENYESTSTSTSSKCTYVKPDKCSASKEAHCARENKLPCTKGKNSGTCGACLEGFIVKGNTCKAPAGLSISAPTGKDAVKKNRPVPIVWTTNKCGKTVTVEMCRLSDLDCKNPVFKKSTKNDGSYGIIAKYGPGDFFIQITDGKGCEDMSNEFRVRA